MTLAAERPTFAPRPKRWTKREYNDLVDCGAFHGQHVFLFRGELVEVAPMGLAHAIAVNRVHLWACRAFSPPYMVRGQSPFATPGQSVPEPDVAVVTEDQFIRGPQSNEALLIIEVSDTSLKIDQEKSLEYAAAGVPDYWILDVVARRLIVHREIVADTTAPLGFRYAAVQVFDEAARVSPLAKPEAVVAAREFLQGF